MVIIRFNLPLISILTKEDADDFSSFLPDLTALIKLLAKSKRLLFFVTYGIKEHIKKIVKCVEKIKGRKEKTSCCMCVVDFLVFYLCLKQRQRNCVKFFKHCKCACLCTSQ